MKNKIDGIVIVEGKTDTQKLKSIFDVQTIETNGSAISEKTINLIKKASLHHRIYLFLDPDYVGEKIRKTIMQHVDETINIFIKPNVMKCKSKKIGVAEATTEAIIEAFKNAIVFNTDNDSITYQQFEDLSLNSVKKRNFICDNLGISYCNQKTLFKRLNMMNKTFNEIQTIMEQYHE